MRFVLLLLFLYSLPVFGQQFHPDVSGHVNDSAFLKLIKNRNYSLVGAFDSLPCPKPAMAAKVLQNNSWIYIDWNGKEYVNYDELGMAFGFDTRPTAFWENVDPGERIHAVIEELELVPDPNGYTGEYHEDYFAGFKYHDKIVVPAAYEEVEQLYHHKYLFLKVRKDGHYAIFDYQGKALTPFIYEEVFMLEQPTPACTFRVRSENRCGVLSQQTEPVIPVIFDKITEFGNGQNHLLLVQKDSLFGAYNFSGNQIVPTVYEYLEPFWSESPKLVLSAKRNGKYGLLGMSGETTIPCTYRDRLYYGAKQAFITYSDDNYFRKIGALDTTGKPLLPPVFGLIYQPEGANCLFVMNNFGNDRKFGVYDLTGKKVLDTIYNSYQPFGAISENERSEPAKYFVFSFSDEKRSTNGVFDIRTLQWVIPCEYDLYSISRNYLLIGKGSGENRQMGLMNRKGKWVIPLQYADLDYREDDQIAVVKQNGNYGVIDFKGVVLIPFRYKRLTMLPKGYFIFSHDSLCGLMKLNQKVIIPTTYNAISPTHSGFIGRYKDSCAIISFAGKSMLEAIPVESTESISGIFSWKATRDSVIMKDLYGNSRHILQSVSNLEGSALPPQITESARVYDNWELEIPARFPGDEPAIKKFLAENLRYPQYALEIGIQGKCYLEFVVNVNGKLSDFVLLRGVANCPECDREAIRVIKTMPDWMPAQYNGAAVNSRVRILVVFRLD